MELKRYVSADEIRAMLLKSTECTLIHAAKSWTGVLLMDM